MIKNITSLQNERIKAIAKMKKGKEIIVDGLRENLEAQKYQLKPLELYLCKELQTKKIPFNNYIEVSKAVFTKICYKENPDGVLGIYQRPELKLTDIKLSKNPLILVLEKIEKPGNLGAIIRTAYALNIDAIICTETKLDIYNPNAIRSSQGLIFGTQVITENNIDTKTWLIKNKINIITTNINTKKKYTDINYKKPTAIVLGSEDLGLTTFWQDNPIKIPMKPGIDSLNLSVSAAIIITEAQRQRNFDF